MVFQVDFPVFKVVVGIFLVLLGYQSVCSGGLILPSHHFEPEETIFNERVYDNPESGKEYTVLFAKGVYDFTNVDLSKGSFHAKISTVFGGTQIIIPRDKPVRITADAVFAGAELPDKIRQYLDRPSMKVIHGVPIRPASTSKWMWFSEVFR